MSFKFFTAFHIIIRLFLVTVIIMSVIIWYENEHIFKFYFNDVYKTKNKTKWEKKINNRIPLMFHVTKLKMIAKYLVKSYFIIRNNTI